MGVLCLGCYTTCNHVSVLGVKVSHLRIGNLNFPVLCGSGPCENLEVTFLLPRNWGF